jgi:hypothetical protein
VQGFSGDGGPAVKAKMRLPQSLAVDATGTLYITSHIDFRIRTVDGKGVITTVAGSGTPPGWTVPPLPEP